MALQRSNTRFGVPTLRGSIPESDESRVSSPVADSHLKKQSKNLYENQKQELSRPRLRKLPQPTTKASISGPLKIQQKSPWESLTKRFQLSLETSVTIATAYDGSLVAVREISEPKDISEPSADCKIKMLQRIRLAKLPNFLAFLDCFSHEGSLYAVFEHEIAMHEKLVTLRQYSLVPTPVTESQLAIILREVLRSLKALAEHGLQHGALTCKNVLISAGGAIKIAEQECCRELDYSQSSLAVIQGVRNVAMELINKIQDPTPTIIKVPNTRLWPIESQAVQFLLKTQTASSIVELENHPLFDHTKRQRDLSDIKAHVFAAECHLNRGYVP